MDVLKMYVDVRFRLWTNNETFFIIYEQCPEEGPNVSKKLTQFNNEDEANTWLEQHKQNYLKWLKSFVHITGSSQPSSPAPSALSTTSSLRKAMNPHSKSSRRGSKNKPKSESTTDSSSETSAASSTRFIKVPAEEVEVGDTILYSTKRMKVKLIENTGDVLSFLMESDERYEFWLNEVLMVEETDGNPPY